MKLLYVFVTLLAAAIAIETDAKQTNKDFCYPDAKLACEDKKNNHEPKNCNAKYGGIKKLLPDLQEYINNHIIRNYEYMLMSTHYGNYIKNREGFEKLFMDLSDSKWDKVIDLIKYVTKRGGEMKFDGFKFDTVNGDYELYEMQSLAKALDIEKKLATAAFSIHHDATSRGKEHHDPEVSSYIEHEFVHKQAETVRKLSGHVNDLNKLLEGPDSSLALFIFDDYLKKSSIV